MVSERGSPGVEHGSEADAGAEVLRIRRHRGDRLGRGLEQEIVDRGLVGERDGGDGRRQGEHHVDLRHGQQIGLALGEPALRRRALALRAVPVAAGVVGDGRVGAGGAACDVAAERRRAAALRLATPSQLR